MKKLTEAAMVKACHLSSDKLGKWFEERLKEVFDQLEKECKFRLIRLYDTHSAGSYLPATDGDWICINKGFPYLVEAKCTANGASLRNVASNNISKQQAMCHRLFHRAGGIPLFMFGSVSDNVFQIWDGNYVGTQRAKGKSLEASRGLIVNSTLQLYELTLREYFKC